MINIPQNRISALFEPPDSASIKRSPAQRKASRTNGALSRGPTSKAGKINSSKNALKHGLRSSVLVPPGDSRDYERVYRRIIDNLEQEFDPLTFTEQMAVRSLAHDYLVTDIGQQTVRALLRGKPLSDSEAKMWSQRHEFRRGVNDVKRAIRNYRAGKSWCASFAKAGRLADTLMKLLNLMQTTLDEDKNPKLDPLTPEDIEARKPMEKMRGIVGRYRRKLMDRDYLVGALLDPSRLTKRQRQSVLAILDYAAVMLSRWLTQQPDTVSRKIKESHENMLAASASDPAQLILMQQYLARLDRAIRRKLIDLRGG